MKNRVDISRMSPARRAALYGLICALALIAGYLEILVPLPVSIPGIKLGLGNAVVLWTLIVIGMKPAFIIMLVKVVCSALLFANLQALAFSLAGGVVSWALMTLAWRSGVFSVIATSVLGGIAHNVGQLAMVALLLSPTVAAVNTPVLAVAGAICGLLIGIVDEALLRTVPAGGSHA